MNHPKLALLSSEEIHQVHESSVYLLEKCGMAIPNKEVLEILDPHAEVDFTTQICKFPRALVEEQIKKAPSEIRLEARNPKHTVKLTKGGDPRFFPNLGAKHVNDLETRERRVARLSDQADFNKVIDSLEYTHAGGGDIVHPSDVPSHLAQYYSWVTAFKNTSKHMWLYLPDAPGVRLAVEIGAILSDSEEKFLAAPIASFITCPPEVLCFETSELRGLVEAFRYRIPVFIESGPAAGATGPATLAGTLVLSNAELLGEITISQILSPGTPVVFMGFARHFDMKAENLTHGSPEFIMMRICQGQMGNYYNLPSYGSGLTADSKILDVQAGYDKAVGLISVLAGHQVVGSDALDTGDIADLAELVVNDELAAAYTRVWRGFKFDKESLAVDEIARVGPGAGHNFMGSRHTIMNFRKESWLTYRITERRKWEVWQKDGAKTAEQRAVQRAKEILRTHRPDELPKDVAKDLDDLLASVK